MRCMEMFQEFEDRETAYATWSVALNSLMVTMMQKHKCDG